MISFTGEEAEAQVKGLTKGVQDLTFRTSLSFLNGIYCLLDLLDCLPWFTFSHFILSHFLKKI